MAIGKIRSGVIVVILIGNNTRAKIASQKKEILEGSEEWDILYRKYYSEGLKRLGVAEIHAH